MQRSDSNFFIFLTMKLFVVALLSLVTCSCAVLLIGSTGTDIVGRLKKDGGVYSGYVTLRERNRTFSIGENLLDFDNIVSMRVTNTNNSPITVHCKTRPYIDRDSISIRIVNLRTGQSVVGYRGVARGLSCRVEVEAVIELGLIVSNISESVRSRQLKVSSEWGGGP